MGQNCNYAWLKSHIKERGGGWGGWVCGGGEGNVAFLLQTCCTLSSVFSKCVHSENKRSSAATNYVTEPIDKQVVYVVEAYSE